LGEIIVAKKIIKVQVEKEIWELFFRYFPAQGERTRLLRNFVMRKIREKRREELDKLDKIFESRKETSNGRNN